MSKADSINRNYFLKCGQRGGFKRSQGLSALQRKSIARKAANARWRNSPASKKLTSIRLDDPQLSNATFIEELLSEGSLDDWKQLYHAIENHPFGSVAVALEQTLLSTPIYGVTPLWRGLLKNVQAA